MKGFKYAVINLGRNSLKDVLSKDFVPQDIPGLGVKVDIREKIVYSDVGESKAENGIRITPSTVKRKFVPTQEGRHTFAGIKQILFEILEDKSITLLIIGPPIMAEAFPGEVYTFKNDHGNKEFRIDDLRTITR